MLHTVFDMNGKHDQGLDEISIPFVVLDFDADP